MPENQAPASTPAPAPAPGQAQTVVVKVGMHCEGCRRKVKKALSKIPGVEELKIDLKEQKVTIRGAVDVKRVMSQLARTGKANEIVASSPAPAAPADTNKSKESPAPAPAAAAGSGAAPSPASLATLTASTEAAILKDMPMKPMVWINAPDFLSDENPNACSIM